MAGTAPDDTRIVYCREVDPDTVLHMSVYGDDYVMRRFDGSDPFDVAAQPSYQAMRLCYRLDYDRPLTDDESRHQVEDSEYWSRRIAEVNDEVLPTLADQPSATP